DLLRQQRAAVAVVGALDAGTIGPAELKGTKHASGVLGEQVRILMEYAQKVASGTDPVSIARAGADKLLRGEDVTRLGALSTPQGFPIGAVAKSTFKLTCPFAGR